MKLLARTLTSVLQEQENVYPETQNETFVTTSPATDPSASQSHDLGVWIENVLFVSLYLSFGYYINKVSGQPSLQKIWNRKNISPTLENIV